MTSQKMQFCDEYLKHLNATKAALTAGYSQKTAGQIGHNLLQEAEVQAYISERQERVMRKLDWSFEKLLMKFGEVADKCMQAEPVRDSQGTPTGEFKFDASNVNRAYENIGKHLGFFEADNKQRGADAGEIVIRFE